MSPRKQSLLFLFHHAKLTSLTLVYNIHINGVSVLRCFRYRGWSMQPSVKRGKGDMSIHFLEWGAVYEMFPAPTFSWPINKYNFVKSWLLRSILPSSCNTNNINTAIRIHIRDSAGPYKIVGTLEQELTTPFPRPLASIGFCLRPIGGHALLTFFL